ncbi:MAG TPA: hypothetical protein OIM12_09515 [Faecalibacterium prausnitzii]|nr:hypothetical protein [Faecalibacterium prausnitzii]
MQFILTPYALKRGTSFAAFPFSARFFGVILYWFLKNSYKHADGLCALQRLQARYPVHRRADNRLLRRFTADICSIIIDGQKKSIPMQAADAVICNMDIVSGAPIPSAGSMLC